MRQCQRTREKEPDVRLAALLKIVDRCGGCGSMHPQKKKAAYSFFLRYETDLPQSTSMPPTPSCYFVFFYIFYFFTFAPVCSCLACVGPIERFPPSSSSPCRSVGIETRSIHLLEREAGCVVYRRSQVSRLNRLFPATTFQGLCLVSASS